MAKRGEASSTVVPSLRKGVLTQPNITASWGWADMFLVVALEATA